MDASKKYKNSMKGKKRIKKDYSLSFIELGIACNIVLADYKLSINVDGYDDFLLEYVELSEMDSLKQFEIIKDAILWQDHLNSIKSLMSYVIADKESVYEYYKNLKPARKRKHIMKDMMDLTTSEIKILKMYLTSLESQISLCDRIQYHVKKNYLKSNFFN